MTILEVLEAVDRAGVRVTVEGNQLLATPAGKLPSHLREELKTRKLEVIDALYRDLKIEREMVEQMERLVRALGAEVETPVGRGRLLYITQHGAVVQIPSGLMYTLDPRKVKP